MRKERGEGIESKRQRPFNSLKEKPDLKMLQREYDVEGNNYFVNNFLGS